MGGIMLEGCPACLIISSKLLLLCDELISWIQRWSHSQGALMLSSCSMSSYSCSHDLSRFLCFGAHHPLTFDYWLLKASRLYSPIMLTTSHFLLSVAHKLLLLLFGCTHYLLKPFSSACLATFNTPIPASIFIALPGGIRPCSNTVLFDTSPQRHRFFIFHCQQIDIFFFFYLMI